MALSLQGQWTISNLQFLAPVGHDDDAVVRAIVEWADVARRILIASGGQEIVDALFSYVLKVTKLDRQRLRIVIEQQCGAPAMKKFKSTYEQILEEGVAKGTAIGEARGDTAGRAQLLLHLLHKRFGPLPPDCRQRVLGASRDDLDRWADAVLDATSLVGVFGGAP